MNACKPTILFEAEDVCIAQCQHCQRVGMTFRNLLLGFTPDEYVGLCRTLDTVSFEQNSARMPDGQLHLILNTGHPDIQFSLSRADHDALRSGMLRALRRLNLYQLLKIQSN